MVGNKGEGGADTAPGLLAGEPAPLKAIALENQDNPLRGAPLGLLVRRCTCKAAPNHPDPKKRSKCQCVPRVELRNRGTSTLVSVANPIWGWPNLTREYLHQPLAVSSPAAHRYAESLRQRIADAAWKESARRERQRELRQREREALKGGGR